MVFAAILEAHTNQECPRGEATVTDSGKDGKACFCDKSEGSS